MFPTGANGSHFSDDVLLLGALDCPNILMMLYFISNLMVLVLLCLFGDLEGGRAMDSLHELSSGGLAENALCFWRQRALVYS